MALILERNGENFNASGQMGRNAGTQKNAHLDTSFSGCATFSTRPIGKSGMVCASFLFQECLRIENLQGGVYKVVFIAGHDDGIFSRFAALS